MLRIIITITIICTSCLYNQVNTEEMRGECQIPGIHSELELDFGYISGTSEFLELNGSYRMDYISKADWKGFIVGKYDRAFEKSKDDFSNKGFGHLRFMYPVKGNIKAEGFLQKEFNHFIDLTNRELAGAGLRFNPKEKFYWGTGIMIEKEKYQDISDEQNFVKSTNYLNYSVEAFNLLEVQNIFYYQFKLKNQEDYRILWDGKLTFPGPKRISFHVSWHYRYDKSVISPEGNSYFEVSNGLSFRF